MIHSRKDKNQRSADGSKGIKEQRERRKTQRLILGTAVLILAVGIAGGFAMHHASQEKAREAAQQREEERQEEKAREEEQLTPEEEKAREIAEVKEQAREEGCPEEIIGLIDQNEETLDFVRDYAENKDKPVPETVEASTGTGTIPHYLQWDERWGYSSYGTSTIASSGCGPTCMSMVIVGLTGDTTATPYRLARYSEENGFIDEENNTY